MSCNIAATPSQVWSHFHPAREDGTTDFAMVEVFAGVMLPLIKSSLPDFAPVFERYAGDLKREAESGRPS